jgi:cytochrome c biogenesis protein CcdA
MNEVAELLYSALTGGRVVALPLALIGGLVAALNPCCLPLYPAAVATCGAMRGERLQPAFWIAVAFVAGIALVTTALGVAAALAGSVIAGLGTRAGYVIAFVPIVMGLHVLGWVRLPLPRPGIVTPGQGVVGAFIAGMALSLVLAPCGTPVLASVLSYAAHEGSVAYGALLLFLYGLGAGVPICAAGFIGGGIATRIGSGGRQKWVDGLTGVALISLGFYLVWVV